MTPETLHVPLAAGPARLVPITEAHREGLPSDPQEAGRPSRYARELSGLAQG